MSGYRELKYFCVGLSVGAASAFLCAPKSGSQLRKQVRDTANQGASYLKDQADDAKKTVGDLVDRGVRTARHQKENLMAAVDAGKQAFQEAVASTPASDYTL
jgi:gas vesicle protein